MGLQRGICKAGGEYDGTQPVESVRQLRSTKYDSNWAKCLKVKGHNYLIDCLLLFAVAELDR